MATVRLDTLYTDAYRCADQEDQTLCPIAEVTRYLNESIKALRRKIIVGGGAWRLATSGTIAVTAASGATYALPGTGTVQVLNVFWDAGIGRLLHMEEVPPNEDEYIIPGGGWNWDYIVRYEIIGENIKFVPAPAGSYTVTVKYVPAFTDLAMAADTVELYDGWEIWVTRDTAAKMCGKEADDFGVAKNTKERDEAWDSIHAILRRNRGEPKRVQDVYKPVGRWYY